MPDIYILLNGQQAGPYQPDQIDRMLSDGAVLPSALAWHEGLTEWVALEKVLAKPVAGSLPFPPVPPNGALLRTRSETPVKKERSGCFWAAVILGGASLLGIFLFSCLVGLALGPINQGLEKARENTALQQVREIALLMQAYSVDHNGAYPDGETSTEVFQKLIDEKYTSDPGLFYLAMPGKVMAISDQLKAENVCFDVSSGPDLGSTYDVPIVFSTGYVVTYSKGVNAVRSPEGRAPFRGMAIAYTNSWTYQPELEDTTIQWVISARFNHAGVTYRQLRP